MDRPASKRIKYAGITCTVMAWLPVLGLVSAFVGPHMGSQYDLAPVSQWTVWDGVALLTALLCVPVFGYAATRLLDSSLDRRTERAHRAAFVLATILLCLIPLKWVLTLVGVGEPPRPGLIYTIVIIIAWHSLWRVRNEVRQPVAGALDAGADSPS